MTDADRDFLARFEAARLRRERWDHRAHLRVAFLTLRRHGWPDAIRHVRAGIRRLNRALGVEDGPSSGYHETLTLCWLRLVGDALLRHGAAVDFDHFIARHPELLSQQRVLRHYSRERIGSARARREFVLPDREPLPRLASRALVRNGSAPGKDSGGASPDSATGFVNRPGSRRTST